MSSAYSSLFCCRILVNLHWRNMVLVLAVLVGFMGPLVKLISN